MTDTWLVVGLGNPGPTYAKTRHNVGFLTVDELASRSNTKLSVPLRVRAEVGRTRISAAGFGVPGLNAARVVLAKPRTYMNESGQAVSKLVSLLKIAPEQVIVIHDELDLDLGRLKLKIGGGDNGHNGLKSIRAHLKTGDFYRVRIGIGRPPGRQTGADYVLSSFPASQWEDAQVVTKVAADACETLMLEGLEVAQNRFNS